MYLTEDEQALATRLRFPVEMLKQVKEIAHTPLHKITLQTSIKQRGCREVSSRVEGLFVLVPGGQSAALVQALRPVLLSKGYLAFIVAKSQYDDPRIRTFDDHGHYIPDAIREAGIAVVPGTDIHEFIASYIHEKAVIKKLQEWAFRCTFDILGVGRNWLQLAFATLPDDLYALAVDVRFLCPDLKPLNVTYVDEKRIPWEDRAKEEWAQEAEAIAQEIQQTQRLYLFWS